MEKSKLNSKKEKINIKKIKYQNELNKTKQFKEKYFNYYDDVKSNTHDVYDW